MIKIAIVEDQTMLRESLASAINSEEDMEVVLSLADASELAGLAATRELDLALLDVCTANNSSGIVAARKLKEAQPHIKTVIMTGVSDITFVKKAREARVDSFVYKNVSTSELIVILRSTAGGYSTFPSARPSSAPELELLSDIELDILYLVCETKSRKEIAQELYLSESVVKRHITEMLAKTGYDSIMKLAVHAVTSGGIAARLER